MIEGPDGVSTHDDEGDLVEVGKELHWANIGGEREEEGGEGGDGRVETRREGGEERRFL